MQTATNHQFMKYKGVNANAAKMKKIFLPARHNIHSMIRQICTQRTIVLTAGNASKT